MNNVHLIGHLGTDVELRFTPEGTAVCDLRIATNEDYKDKEGVKHESTEWHRVVVWNGQAKNCAKYLKKGSLVSVEGKLHTRSWDKDGEKRYTTEVIASHVEFLDSKPKNTTPTTT